jgi:hypothetical protein
LPFFIPRYLCCLPPPPHTPLKCPLNLGTVPWFRWKLLDPQGTAIHFLFPSYFKILLTVLPAPPCSPTMTWLLLHSQQLVCGLWLLPNGWLMFPMPSVPPGALGCAPSPVSAPCSLQLSLLPSKPMCPPFLPDLFASPRLQSLYLGPTGSIFNGFLVSLHISCSLVSNEKNQESNE